MQRFRPASRPNTLHYKVSRDLAETRFMPPAARSEVRVAAMLGMDDDARAALERIAVLAKSRRTAVAGRFMPDRGVGALLTALGVEENVAAEDFFRFRAVVIPYGGISARQRREWEQACHPLEDLTSPQVRRAQVALGLLKMEGAQALVIGRHDDPESQAIAGGGSAARILETTADTARLTFAPCFGAVCQTTLPPRRVAWLVQQLRHRWHDARVTFLDTISRSMAARDESLERLLVDCDRAVIVGEPGESSCEALVETTTRRGRQAVVVSSPDELNLTDFPFGEKIALTAGAFATDDAIRAVAAALNGHHLPKTGGNP